MSEVTTRELLERWAHGLCAQWARTAAPVPPDAAHLIGKLLKRAYIEGVKYGLGVLVTREYWDSEKRQIVSIEGQPCHTVCELLDRELTTSLFGPDASREGDGPPLSPAEFAAAVAECGRGDPEGGHMEADELLCEQLRRLGYGKGVEEFEQLSKWYA